MPRKTVRQTYKAVAQQAVKAGIVPQQAFKQAMASIDQHSDAEIKKDIAALRREIKKSKKQAGGQQAKKKTTKRGKSLKQKTKAIRQSAKARIQKTKASHKAKLQARKATNVTKPLRSRAGKIMRAIKAGKIAAKQGKSKPMDFTSLKSNREKYEAFVKLYAGVVLGRKSKTKKSKKRVSAKAAYQSIKAQGKKPYMLKKGYRIPYKVIGGGGKGAGIIKAIPGSKAIPFAKLSDAEQREVVAFLNSDEGKMLRGKGAPKTVSLQKIQAQAAAQQTRRKSVKSRKSAKSRKQK